MKVTVGRWVHYHLSEGDAQVINRTRSDQRSPGNQAEAGQIFPAVVVRKFGEGTTVNLQVSLDGPDTYWATSRSEGDQPGTWAWPPRY